MSEGHSRERGQSIRLRLRLGLALLLRLNKDLVPLGDSDDRGCNKLRKGLACSVGRRQESLFKVRVVFVQEMTTRLMAALKVCGFAMYSALL